MCVWLKSTPLVIPKIPTQAHAFFFRFFLSLFLCFESLPDDDSDLSCKVNKVLRHVPKNFDDNSLRKLSRAAYKPVSITTATAVARTGTRTVTSAPA